MLGFDGVVTPALRSMDESVLYLGSMSKVFSPGIRIGWVLAPAEVRMRLQIAAEAASIHPPCSVSIWHSRICNELTGRVCCAKALRATRGVLTGSWRPSSGKCRMDADGPLLRGFFTWLRLPEGVSAQRVFDAALDEGVAFVPGAAFFADSQGSDGNLRLSFSLETPDRLDEGVQRLARALRRVMA